MQETLKQIGSNIRQLRIKKNLSQQQLADLAGLRGKATISDIERGVSNYTLSTLFKICVALNCEPHKMIK